MGTSLNLASTKEVTREGWRIAMNERKKCDACKYSLPDVAAMPDRLSDGAGGCCAGFIFHIERRNNEHSTMQRG